MKNITKTLTSALTILAANQANAIAIDNLTDSLNTNVEYSAPQNSKLQDSASDVKRKTINELIAFEAQKAEAQASLQTKLALFESSLPESLRFELAELLDIGEVLNDIAPPYSPEISVFLKPQQVHEIPEPMSLPLLGAGLAAAFGLRRRWIRKSIQAQESTSTSTLSREETTKTDIKTSTDV